MNLRVLAITILSIGTLSSGVVHSADSIWTQTFDQKIRWQLVASPEVLLVATDAALTGVGTSDGKVLWELATLPRVDSNFIQLFPQLSIAMLDLTRAQGYPDGTVACLDLTNGKIRWTTEALGITRSMGWYQLGESGPLMGFAEAPDMPEKTAMVALDVTTGGEVWRRGDFFPDPGKKRAMVKPRPEKIRRGTRLTILACQPPMILSDTSFIVAMTNYGVSKHDTRTGALVWHCDFPRLGSASLESGRAPMMLLDSLRTLLVSFEFKLIAINVETGVPVWSEPSSFPNVVSQMQVTPHGLLVRSGLSDRALEDQQFADPKLGGGDRLTLLDPLTGVSKWPGEPKTLYNPTNFICKDEFVYLGSSRKLVRYDLMTGNDTVVVDSVVGPLEVRPIKIASAGDDYSIHLYRRLIGFDSDWKRTYDTTYDAPKSVLGVVLEMSAGMVQELYNPFHELDDPSHSGSRPLWPQDPQDRYRMIVAKAESGQGREWALVRIDLLDGHPTSVAFTGQSEPRYRFNDELTQVWVTSKDDRSITSFRF